MLVALLVVLALCFHSLGITGCATAVGGNGGGGGGDGGGGSGDGGAGLTDAEVAAGQDVADAVTVTGQMSGIVDGIDGASDTTATSGVRQLPLTADEIETRLQAIWGDTVTVEGNITSFTVTFANTPVAGGLVTANGTLTVQATVSLATMARTLTITTEGFTLGAVTVSGSLTASRTQAGGDVALTANMEAEVGQSTLSLQIEGQIQVQDSQILVAGIAQVTVNDGTPLTVTIEELVVSATQPYPIRATATFTYGGKQLTVSLSTEGEEVSVTVSDGQGHTSELELLVPGV